MIRACAIAVGILVLSDLLWLIVLQRDGLSDGLSIIWWCAIAISGFTVASIAPKKKLELSLLLGVISALLVCITKLIHEAFGNPVDLPGIYGTSILFLITAPWHLALCTFGGIAAWLLSKRS